jgi:hypothetical protein
MGGKQADPGEGDMGSKIKQSGMATERHAELKRILDERRREILNEVQEKMRDVRAVGASGEGQGVHNQRGLN